jgi:pentose-5-phosphate-3-epimerase
MLVPSTTTKALVQTIQKFMKALREVHLTLRQDNKVVHDMQQDKVNSITLFFFQETFGAGAYSRVIALIKHIAKESGTNDSLSHSKQVVTLAKHDNILLDFR